MVPLPSGPNQGMFSQEKAEKFPGFFEEMEVVFGMCFFSTETKKTTLIDDVFNKWIELVRVILLKRPFPMQKMVRFFEYFST